MATSTVFFQEGANSEVEQYRTMVMFPGARCWSSDAVCITFTSYISCLHDYLLFVLLP